MNAAVRYSVMVWAAVGPTLAMAQALPDEDQVRQVMPPHNDEEDEPVAQPTAPLGTVTYEQHASAGARQNGVAGAVAMQQFSVSTGFPVFFDGPRTMLAVGLMYGRTDFDYDTTAAVGPSVFHTFKATLTFRHDFNERWGLLLRYVPNLSTNMSDVTMSHVTHNGQVIGTYQLGPHETLYFGVAFSQAIPWYVLPGAGYELYTGRWHVELRAPEKIEAGYMLTSRIEVGGTARYQNTLFGIGGVSQLDKISYTSAWAGGTIDVRLFAGLHLRAALGRTVMRRFRGIEDGTDTRAVALDQTMVGRFGLSYEVDRDR